MINVPKEFRFQDKSRYPSDNIEDFEWWMSNHMSSYVGEREYLPITWTAYYKMFGYGENKTAIAHLQRWLEANLERGKKYWTIIQFDNGILNDLSAWDVRVYAMGSPGDYQLPLICQPHAYTPPTRMKKDIFCSFVGRVTHPIRQKIVDQLTGKDGYYISTKHHQLLHYCEILARSKFVIACRGYGATSFRLCEALQYGATPIYMSDVYLEPHGSTKTFLSINPDRMELFESLDILDLHNTQKNLSYYQEYYTYSANKELILKDLKVNQ